MKNRSDALIFLANLSLCFLLSDITVLICHVRNPYMRFLNSLPSYVLFGLSALCVALTLVLFLRRKRK